MNFIEITIIASLIIMCAFFIRGLTGFASSLIAVPLLSLFLDIKFVVPVMAVLVLVAASILFLMTKKHIQKKEFLFVLVFVMIGTVIGTKILVDYDSILLKKIFGVFVILFALKMLFSSEKKIIKKIKKFWGIVAGLISGIFGGMFGTSGPPLVIYFGHRYNKEAFRATLTAIFLVNIIWRNILYIINQIMTLETFKFSLFLLPALIIGLFLGAKVHIKVNETIFKKVVAVIILITGMFLII